MSDLTAANGTDNLIGNNGNDTLIGSGAVDRLKGTMQTSFTTGRLNWEEWGREWFPMVGYAAARLRMAHMVMQLVPHRVTIIMRLVVGLRAPVGR